MNGQSLRNLRAALSEATNSSAAHAAFWTGAGFIGSNILRFASSLLLTRMLAPEVFGLMALANIIMTGLALLSDFGLRESIVRYNTVSDEKFNDTVWTLQILRGILISAIAALLAFPISEIYNQPQLLPLILFLSLGPIATGFQSILFLFLSREMNVRMIVIITISAQFLGFVVTIFLAWYLRTIWALAIGALVNSISLMLLTYILLDRRAHRLTLEKEIVVEVVSFGKWIFLATAASFIGANGLQAIQGGLVSIEALGVISISYLLGKIPGQLLAKVNQSVTFPKLTKLSRENPTQIPQALVAVKKLILVLGVLPSLMVAFFSIHIVEFLYDPRYAAAAVFMAVVLCDDAIFSQLLPYQSMLLSQGNSKSHAMVSLVWSLLRMFLTIVGFLWFGLLGMVILPILATIIRFFHTIVLVPKLYRQSKFLDLLGSILVLVAMLLFFRLNSDAVAELLAAIP